MSEIARILLLVFSLLIYASWVASIILRRGGVREVPTTDEPPPVTPEPTYICANCGHVLARFKPGIHPYLGVAMREEDFELPPKTMICPECRHDNRSVLPKTRRVKT